MTHILLLIVRKLFLNLLFAFLEHFEKKSDPHSLCINDITDFERHR